MLRIPRVKGVHRASQQGFRDPFRRKVFKKLLDRSLTHF